MVMKLKQTFGLLLALTIAAGAASVADAALSVEAASASVAIDRENAELLLPDSYEEYLPLENPAYMAMSEHYIAVADGTLLYIYDRGDGAYTCYDAMVTTNNSVISKIQISNDERLFFSAGISLFEYRFAENEATIVNNVSCNTFLVEGDYLYTSYIAANSQVSLKRYPLANPSRDHEMEITTVPNVSTYSKLTTWNGILYCVRNDRLLTAYDTAQMAPGKNGQIGGMEFIDDNESISDIQRICAYNDYLYYSVDGDGAYPNGLWRTDFKGNADLILEGDGYSAITTYDGRLYCIKDASVMQLNVTEDGIESADYEIAASSSSPHRLANAVEAARTKELVVYADAGNRRISVYDRFNDGYTVIPCLDGSGEPFTPEHVAIDKEERRTEPNGDAVTANQIAVSSGKNVYVYTLERHSLYPEKNGVSNPVLHAVPQNVKGMSFVYGECYFITEYDGYGALGNGFTTELHFTGINSPEAIASDIYGTIYVAFGNRIFSFTEEEFRKDHARGQELTSLSESTAKVYVSLTADYEGNVWYLTEDGRLYCNGEATAEIDGKDFVYLSEEHDYPVSFALSFEDDEIYFNFKNYVVKTKPYALDSLVSLNKITAGEAKTAAFAPADPDNLFVRIPAGSVGFEIDLDALKTGEGEYFPYERYSRETGATEDALPRRGVLLYEPTEDDGYYVVALYEEDGNSFSAHLFKKSKNKLTPDENYFKEANETRYVTSDVSLCFAPCLYPAPAGERLSTLSDALLKRGDKLNVLGYAEGEDRAYAYVEVVSDEKAAKRGYVPRSYLTANDPLGIPDDVYTLGYLAAGTTLRSAGGNELTATADMQVKLYENADGTYTAVVEKDGVVYTGTVTADDIMRGEPNALRISLIVILSVLALVIVTGYVFLMFPRKKKR